MALVLALSEGALEGLRAQLGPQRLAVRDRDLVARTGGVVGSGALGQGQRTHQQGDQGKRDSGPSHHVTLLSLKDSYRLILARPKDLIQASIGGFRLKSLRGPFSGPRE
jgi:hypothetical protein